jgi:hypothetical protein
MELRLRFDFVEGWKKSGGNFRNEILGLKKLLFFNLWTSFDERIALKSKNSLFYKPLSIFRAAFILNM